MAEQKKYYWLRLKDDFFTSKRIKKLRKLGADYLIIYLKMQLKALKTDGYLYITGIEDNIADEIALDIDEDSDKVQLTLSYLQACGLVETQNNGDLFLPYVEKMTGSETSSAQRVRAFRERQKETQALQCNTTVTDVKQNVNGEKEIEKEIEIEKKKELDTEIEKECVEGSANATPNTPTKKPKKATKHKYGQYQNVLLTDDELDRLKADYGASTVDKAITFFDEYIEEKGYKSKSHNLAMRRWVFDAIKEREIKTGKSTGHSELSEWANA